MGAAKVVLGCEIFPKGEGLADGFAEKFRFVEGVPIEGVTGETANPELGNGCPSGLGVANTDLKLEVRIFTPTPGRRSKVTVKGQNCEEMEP